MGMNLYIAQKLTEARMRELRDAGAGAVLPGATDATGSGERPARLSPRPAGTAAGARHCVPGEKT
jgi:hypothetical protein